MIAPPMPTEPQPLPLALARIETTRTFEAISTPASDLVPRGR
jgi:hypothetical protein